MRKFIAEVIERSRITDRIVNSYEVPVYAESLDEALEEVDQKYTQQGIEVGRIYQQVTINNSEVK